MPTISGRFARPIKTVGAVAGWLSLLAAAVAVAAAGVGRSGFDLPSLRWLAAAVGAFAAMLLVWAVAWYVRGRRGRRDGWMEAGLPLLASADAWLMLGFQYAHEPTNHLLATGLVTTDLIAQPAIPEWLIAKHVLIALLWALWPTRATWTVEDSEQAGTWRPAFALGLAVLAAAAFARLAILDILLIEVPSDLRVNYVGALAMREGLNPYDNAVALQVAGRERIPYVGTRLWAMVTNPPTAMLYFAPFTLFPLHVARLLFLAANQIALLAALGLMWRLLRPRLHWTVWLGAMLAVIVLLDPVLLAFRLGQVDLVILALLVGAALRLRRGDDVWGGVLIGIAAAFKFTPVLLALYLIWRGRWRALAGAIIAGVAVAAASLPLAGIDTWRFYFQDRLPDLLAGSPLTNNLSLPGMVLRVFMGPQLGQGFLDLQPEIPLARTLGYVGMALILVASAWALGRARRPGGAFVLEFGLALTTALLIAGVTWPHYLTWLLLIAGMLVAGPGLWRTSRGPAIMMGLGLALAAMPFDAYAGLFGWAFDRSVVALSARTIGLLVAWLGMLLAMRWTRPAGEPAEA